MNDKLQRRLLTAAAVAGLAGLGLMLWALFDSSPLVLMTSMTLGQACGTLSFGLYLLVVVMEVRRAWLARGGQTEPEAAAESRAP